MIVSQLKNHPMPADYDHIFFGDNQEGNIAQAEDKFKECIEFILENPNRYASHMGDAIDAFWVDDKRYDTDTTVRPPIKQANKVIEMLAPLAKANRLITMLLGNHELALKSKIGNITEEYICPELRKISGTDWPIYGTYSNKLVFYDDRGKIQHKAYITHGRKMISSVSPDPHRKLANMQYRLKLLLEKMAGDCIVMVRGHSHIVLVTPPIPTLYLVDESGRLKQRYTHSGMMGSSGSSYIPPDHRWYGCSGSFLKSQVLGVDTYSEIAEYSPTELGYLIGEIRDNNFQQLLEKKI
jgi:hypothetical protein